MGLADKADKKPHSLSGGEQQRVSITRAVAHKPKILFADEPTANLDTASGQSVIELFEDLHKKGQTIVMVTHDLDTIYELSTRVAVLADKVWWGNFAKSMVFMPMAISFVGASVIWKFVFDFRGPDSEQIGILNAMVMGLGGTPQAWVTIPFWNNFFLMAILIWIQTGFAMVILSAALRGVPTETIEAARIDGASELHIFFEIMVPQIMSTVLVVWTTITITVLKVFDIVMAMTGGQWDTSVLANLMYDWMFRGGGDYGRSSTLAMVLMFAVVPVMAFNIRRFRTEEAQR